MLQGILMNNALASFDIQNVSNYYYYYRYYNFIFGLIIAVKINIYFDH